MAYVSVEDFDPADPAKFKAMWLVYTGEMKVYANRGPAIARLLRRYGSHDAKLFEWDAATGWKLVAYRRQMPKDSPCELCGGPTVSATPHGYHDSNHGEWVFDRKNRKLINPLRLMWTCYPCRDGRGL